MASEENIMTEGKVKELLSNGMYKVDLGSNLNITARLSGKMRMNKIKVLQGDDVKIEMSPYDMTKGRITFRNR